jgi:hypothetical protein
MVEDKGHSTSKFTINEEKLTAEVLRIYNAAIQGKDIFYGGPEVWRKRFLPQWRIPKEMEYEPSKVETRDPKLASKFLWTCVQLERQANSAYLERQFHNIWKSQEHRWFFYSEEMTKRKWEDIDFILDNILHYRIKVNPKKELAKSIQDNAIKLNELYGGDPRLMIKGLSVDEARKRHMEFEGVGTGIANLNLIHFYDRNLSAPIDPENMLFKIDIHKARIPLNVGAITLDNGASRIHMSSIVPRLEETYKKICLENKLDPSIADAAIWIIGSSGCAKENDPWCYDIKCPLLETCLVNTPLDQKNGTYQIFDQNRKRVDRNKKTDYMPSPPLIGFEGREDDVANLFLEIEKQRDEVAKRPHKRWRQPKFKDHEEFSLE